MHRQISAMTLPAIRSHVEVPLDICRDVAPEIAFNLAFLFDHLADLGRIVIGQIVTFQIEGNACLSQYVP
jgi:hypothetical protein